MYTTRSCTVSRTDIHVPFKTKKKSNFFKIKLKDFSFSSSWMN